MAENDISKMKITDLKREQKLRALPITGNKVDLQERLQSAIDGGEVSLEDTAISGEDLLEEVCSDEEKKGVSTLPPVENELLKPPTSELSTSAELSPDNADEQPKKIILKRKMFTSLSTESEVSTTLALIERPNISQNRSDSKDNGAKRIKLDEKPNVSMLTEARTDLVDHVENETYSQDAKARILKIDGEPTQFIKPSALTRRLQLRAKKFGHEKKQVSGPKMNSISKTAGTEDVDPQQIEMLKKRAERFGCVLSSAILRIATNEALGKRKQRFGDLLTASTVGNDTYAENARHRLERYKTVA